VLTASHTFTILDIGNAMSRLARAVLSRADPVILVAGGDGGAIAATTAVRELIAAELPGHHTDPVLAVVATRPVSPRRTVKRLRQQGTDRIVAVRHDRSLAAAGSFRPAFLHPSTRAAYLDLASAVTGSPPPMR
jgi:hypothetical protein